MAGPSLAPRERSRTHRRIAAATSGASSGGRLDRRRAFAPEDRTAARPTHRTGGWRYVHAGTVTRRPQRLIRPRRKDPCGIGEWRRGTDGDRIAVSVGLSGHAPPSPTETGWPVRPRSDRRYAPRSHGPAAVRRSITAGGGSSDRDRAFRVGAGYVMRPVLDRRQGSRRSSPAWLHEDTPPARSGQQTGARCARTCKHVSGHGLTKATAVRDIVRNRSEHLMREACSDPGTIQRTSCAAAHPSYRARRAPPAPATLIGSSRDHARAWRQCVGPRPNQPLSQQGFDGSLSSEPPCAVGPDPPVS